MATEMTVQQDLDNLAKARADRARLLAEKQAVKDAILTQELLDRLEEVDEEFADKEDAVEAKISELECDVVDGVREIGHSVKSTYLHAVYTSGRVTWDNKALDGYRAAHPEIEPFRKVGAPSVSIRESKGSAS